MPPTPLERELCEQLADRFFQRRDVVALFNNGHWHPAERPLKGSDLLRHVRGEAALGTYLLDQDNRCRFFTLDLDLDKPNEKTGYKCFSYKGDTDALADMLYRPNGDPIDLEWVECNPRDEWSDFESPLRPWLATTMRMLAEGLARRIARIQHFPVAVTASGGKGMHIHVFCGERPASEARAHANASLTTWMDLATGEPLFTQSGSFQWKHTLEMYQHITIEVFPKQDQIGENGFGNLVRLPLGIHPSSKRPSYFVDLDSDPVYQPAKELDPLVALKEGCCRGNRT